LERGQAVETPETPDTLGEWGSELWSEVWNFGHGIYHQSDYGVIERYCSMQEQCRQLLQIIEVDGLMSTGSTGQPILHPAFKAVHDINVLAQTRFEMTNVTPPHALTRRRI
jgi:P27 family predicted phage terminase small subunit